VSQLRGCFFQLNQSFLATLVCKIQHQVKRNDSEIKAVHNKYIVDLSAHDLSSDAGYIADNDGDHKDKALSLCRVGSQTLIDGDRPGQAKADQHDHFKYLLHDSFLSVTVFFLSLYSSIHLTSPKVKYIIIMEMIIFCYRL